MQLIEAVIARQCIDDLLAAGFVVTVNDGEEDTLIESRERAEIFAAMSTTDEDYLKARRPGLQARQGWVRFIYGNEGWDVISDYTTNLEPYLANTNKLVDSLGNGDHNATLTLFGHIDGEIVTLRLALEIALTELEYADDALGDGDNRHDNRRKVMETVRSALRPHKSENR